MLATSVNRQTAAMHVVAYVEAPTPDTNMRLDLGKDRDPGSDDGTAVLAAVKDKPVVALTRHP